ncbi:DUF5825 family protein [Streptomyces sp. NBC_01262]|uniref:DUF5825 family protein n=1 Tax=Streptomyces sp. NBC_01262 TaxID=2903803 RepID=UPI002E2EF4CF|nr:DUF5825 family protein [Streptomyces sp. NBC_01262]
MVRAGFRAVDVVGPLMIQQSAPHDAVTAIRFLREAAGVGLRVIWAGQVDPELLHLVTHLDPPSRNSGVIPADWQAAPSPQFTVRFGEDFAVLFDERPGGIAESLVTGTEFEWLRKTWNGATIEGSRLPDGLDDLSVRGIVALLGDTALALPVRFRIAR